MLSRLKEVIKRIDFLSKTKPIKIISHYDADGITSAAIFSRALQRWNKKFSMQIVKSLDSDYIKSLPDDSILIFLDLASGSLNYLSERKNEIFIFDHHEIAQKIPENITLINPVINSNPQISSSGICYLFAKELSHQNKDLAGLAVIGMVGDLLDKNLPTEYPDILDDSEAITKKGLLLYPATRPLDRILEYSSNLYIPDVTGSYKGCIELLKDAGIPRFGANFKSLQELTDKEMSSLITSIMLRGISEKDMAEIIGNIYLIKFFNRLEDPRELSALINACSRMDHPEIALGFCLGDQSAKKSAEQIYISYKQQIVSALKYISETEKISGKNYTIINARNNIKDTIIGTIASIISHSPSYSEGTAIIALAYNEDKIKVSARIVGKEGKNIRDVLNKVVVPLGGEVGGHPKAAGCLISKDKEEKFITELKKVLEIEAITYTPKYA